MEIERELELHGEPVTIHLMPATAPRSNVLLLYATGDGGWGGRDLELYRELVSWGYPVVGVSSPDYLNHLDPDSRQLTPEDVAHDFDEIIESGSLWMMLPAPMRVVLVGVSRGADLAVAAAGAEPLQGRLDGVVAIGLTREEEYVRAAPGTTPDMLELYPYLPRLGDVPLSVIQSTQDRYLTAEAARGLFGPDTIHRRLQPIEARDHSFTDARESMYDAILEALDWIDSLTAPVPSAP